jgi:hypothetical protein
MMKKLLCSLTGHRWIRYKQDFNLIQEIIGIDLPSFMSEDKIIPIEVRRCGRCWKKQRREPLIGCKLSLMEEREKKLNEII